MFHVKTCAIVYKFEAVNRRIHGDRMNNWKIVSQIATAFGIAFIVFAALAAFITYGQLTIQYESSIPAGYVQLSVLGAMVPFMLFAVLSLVVAGLSSRSAKEADEKDAKPRTQLLQAA